MMYIHTYKQNDPDQFHHHCRTERTDFSAQTLWSLSQYATGQENVTFRFSKEKKSMKRTKATSVMRITTRPQYMKA